MDGNADDWWYNETLPLNSTEWKKAKIDIRTFQAFDWHPNTSKKCDALRVISLDFVVPSSAPCSGGVLALDDIAMTGLINPAPDFEEAGVELKVTPYRQTPRGIQAKERLVCDMLNYDEEYYKTFETSAFWMKCACMLLMSYEHRDGVPKVDFTIDKAVLFQLPDEDLEVIHNDWKILIEMNMSCQAHLICECDTMYLAACPKGRNSQDTRSQPFSPIPAMKRAYSLKSSYMTQILRRYIFGDEPCE